MNAQKTTAGLLVIRRYRWFEDERVLATMGTPRQPALTLNHEEILWRFRGVEGYSWPPGKGRPNVPLGSNGLVSTSMLQQVKQYFEHVSSQSLSDLLFCQSSSTNSDSSVPEGLLFLGYDISDGTSDMFCYSVIYNEVVYGLYPELREHVAQLNEHLLLRTLPDVEKLLDCRAVLGKKGAALEGSGDREAVDAIAVYGFERVGRDSGDRAKQ